MPHSFALVFFEAARAAPWIVGAVTVVAIGLVLVGKTNIGGWIIGIAAIITTLATVLGFVGTAVTNQHDAGYDMFGGTLWFGIAIIAALVGGIVLLAVHSLRHFIHRSIEK